MAVAVRSLPCAVQFRDHWVQVAELLKLRLMACTKGLQEALQIRAKNIKAQQQRKAKFVRSKWAPLVQLNTPMFAVPPPPTDPTRPTAGTPATPGSAGRGDEVGRTPPAPHQPPMSHPTGRGGGRGRGMAPPQSLPQRTAPPPTAAGDRPRSRRRTAGAGGSGVGASAGAGAGAGAGVRVGAGPAQGTATFYQVGPGNRLPRRPAQPTGSVGLRHRQPLNAAGPPPVAPPPPPAPPLAPSYMTPSACAVHCIALCFRGGTLFCYLRHVELTLDDVAILVCGCGFS